jgi:hypothetical protein
MQLVEDGKLIQSTDLSGEAVVILANTHDTDTVEPFKLPAALETIHSKLLTLQAFDGHLVQNYGFDQNDTATIRERLETEGLIRTFTDSNGGQRVAIAGNWQGAAKK